jgi:hypothetical protein
MNKSELMKKILKQRERDHQRAEFAERKLGEDAQNGAYNTRGVLYTKITCKIYKAGRTYLLKVPKVAVINEGIEPGDMVEVNIRRLESKHGRKG